MWNKILLLTTLSGILFLHQSCEEDDVTQRATSFTEKLTGETSKSWRRVNRQLVVTTSSGKDTFNLDIGVPPCERDNIYTFFKQGNIFEFSEGQSKCDPDDEEIFARGFWEINNANATLLLGGSDPFELVRLTEEELVYGFETSISLRGEARPVAGLLLETYVPNN